MGQEEANVLLEVKQCYPQGLDSEAHRQAGGLDTEEAGVHREDPEENLNF